MLLLLLHCGWFGSVFDGVYASLMGSEYSAHRIASCLSQLAPALPCPCPASPLPARCTLKRLKFGKVIRYESRKQLAAQRPRVKGQFVKRSVGGTNPEAALDMELEPSAGGGVATPEASSSIAGASHSTPSAVDEAESNEAVSRSPAQSEQGAARDGDRGKGAGAGTTFPSPAKAAGISKAARGQAGGPRDARMTAPSITPLVTSSFGQHSPQNRAGSGAGQVSMGMPAAAAGAPAGTGYWLHGHHQEQQQLPQHLRRQQQQEQGAIDSLRRMLQSAHTPRGADRSPGCS